MVHGGRTTGKKCVAAGRNVARLTGMADARNGDGREPLSDVTVLSSSIRHLVMHVDGYPRRLTVQGGG